MQIKHGNLSKNQISGIVLATALGALGYAGDLDYVCEKAGALPQDCGAIPVLSWLLAQSSWIVPIGMFVAVVMFVLGERTQIQQKIKVATNPLEGRIAALESSLEERNKRIDGDLKEMENSLSARKEQLDQIDTQTRYIATPEFERQLQINLTHRLEKSFKTPKICFP